MGWLEHGFGLYKIYAIPCFVNINFTYEIYAFFVGKFIIYIVYVVLHKKVSAQTCLLGEKN